MPYNTFSFSTQVVANENWYRAEAFLQLISMLEKVDPLYHKSKSEALAKLNNMVTRAPFTQANRFPDDQYFIYESGVIEEAIITIRSTLTSKTRTGKTRDVATQDQGQDDRGYSYLHTLKDLKQSLKEGEMVFNQAKFEEYFGLTWTP